MKRNRRKSRQRRYLPSTLSYSGRVWVRPPSVPIDRSLAWFAVWTAPRREREIERRLRALGIRTFLPAEVHYTVRRNVAKPIERIPIGRYLFVGLCPKVPQFGLVREIDGVSDIVHIDGSPLPIPTDAVQSFVDVLASRRVEVKGGVLAKLIGFMTQADDLRLREAA